MGVVGLLAMAGASTAAAEPPAKPRTHLQSVAEIATPAASAQGLGVTLSRATAVLRQQLGIGRGAGLVADVVRPGSAAARAGFLQHDVLVRLDDQILVLPDQFDALLEAAEPSDPLACTVLRGGHEVVIPLGAAPTSQALGNAGQTVQPTEPVRPVGGLRPTASSLAMIPPAARPAGSVGRMRELAAETLVRNDSDFQIRLSRGADTQLTITDPSGRVVFQGAIDAAEDRIRVPEAVRSRVADMERLLEPRGVAGESHVVPASAVATPRTDRPTRIGQLDVPPVELR
jgi:hypothetical protein